MKAKEPTPPKAKEDSDEMESFTLEESGEDELEEDLKAIEKMENNHLQVVEDPPEKRSVNEINIDEPPAPEFKSPNRSPIVKNNYDAELELLNHVMMETAKKREE